MKATLEVEVELFHVPDFVAIKVKSNGGPVGGGGSGNTLPLSSLDQMTLYKLCRAFTCDVFKKAGVEMPPEPA